MDNGTPSNITIPGGGTEPEDLPLYFSTHMGIPDVLIHDLAVVWMAIGMLLNGILIYYLISAKKYRSPVFMLVLFLANSDFLVCLSIACLAGLVFPSYLLPRSTWVICKIVYYLHVTSASTSPYFLVLFAALRFYQLCFPLKARARVTSSFVRNWCLLITLGEIAGWTPFLFSDNLIDVNFDDHHSTICQYTGNSARLTSIAFLIVNTCIPGISIPLFHLMKYIGVACAKNSVEVQQKRKNTDVRALMIIIALFYIGWFPMNIYWLAYKYLPNHRPFQDKLALLFLVSSGSNNTMNPVVYCLAAKSIRRDIIQLFCKKKGGKTKQNWT